MTDMGQLQRLLPIMMEEFRSQRTLLLLDQEPRSRKLMEKLTEEILAAMIETDMGQLQGLLPIMMEDFTSQRTLLLLDQSQLSRRLMEKLTAVQRSATTEQLRVQTERVTTLDANMTSTLTMFASLKSAVFQAKMRAAADFQAAKGEYEGIQELFIGKAAVQGSVISKQLPVQADKRPELELPEYEGIQELFIEEAAIQGAVISKQLPVQTDERADLELPEYEDIPDMSPEEMIEEYLKSRTEEEKEEMIEDGVTPNDMIDYYLGSIEVREEEDFEISAEDMKEAARVENERRAEFFKLPENQGRQGQVPAELRYLTSMEIWDQETNLQLWLGEVVYWADRVNWERLTAADVKSTLWDLLTPERKKFVNILKPGSRSFTHDPLRKYIRRLVATFQPAYYTEGRKQKYSARVHEVGEPVEHYLVDKMKLFKASHRPCYTPYDFKQFLETGLQSIYPPTLRQHIMAQPYRNEEGLMRNIAAISAKLKSLPYSSHNLTGTLAGITQPPRRGESQDVGLAGTRPHEIEVNAAEDVSGQGMQPGDGPHPHSKESGHLAGECQDKIGQEESVRRWEIQERLTRGRGERSVSPTSKRRGVQEVHTQPTRDGGLHPPKPELEDSEGGATRAKQTAPEYSYREGTCFHWRFGQIIEISGNRAQTAPGTLQTLPGAQQTNPVQPGLVGLAAAGLVGLAAGNKSSHDVQEVQTATVPQQMLTGAQQAPTRSQQITTESQQEEAVEPETRRQASSPSTRHDVPNVRDKPGARRKQPGAEICSLNRRETEPFPGIRGNQQTDTGAKQKAAVEEAALHRALVEETASQKTAVEVEAALEAAVETAAAEEETAAAVEEAASIAVQKQLRRQQPLERKRQPRKL